MRSIEYLLKLRAWQWFGTLTWSDKQMGSARSRQANVDEFLRQWASTEHVCLTDMPLAIRWERGEKTERPHCHFLLDGFPDSKTVSKTQGFKKASYWNRRYGIARIRPWSAPQRGQVASYLVKGLGQLEDGQGDWSHSSANEYEVCKFDHADRIVFNKALWLDLQRITQTCFDVAPTT